MPAYTIRYADRAGAVKAALPSAQRASLHDLEKRLVGNPYGHGALRNRDNSWSAFFSGGMITYVVSNKHLVVNVIDVVAT